MSAVFNSLLHINDEITHSKQTTCPSVFVRFCNDGGSAGGRLQKWRTKMNFSAIPLGEAPDPQSRPKSLLPPIPLVWTCHTDRLPRFVSATCLCEPAGPD